VLTAFVLRLVYILQLRANPYFDAPAMDPLYHHDWARAFAAGETFWDGAYFRAPLYPWFLGLIYRLFGADNPLAVRIAQAGLGALSCGLLYLIGRLVFTRTVGVIAGFAAATYWIFMYFEGELLIPVLAVFLDLVLVWLLLWTGERRSPTAWVLSGLALGVSALARPNILLFAPALVVWIFVLHRPRWRRALGYGACLFFGTIAPILPVTIRNYVAGHDLVLIATQGGVNFYIGNNPHSDGKSAAIKGDPGAWWPCYQAQIARAEQAMGRPLKGSEVSQWYFHQTLRFFWQEPGKAAALLLRKLGYFWSHWEIWNNQDMRFVAAYYTPIANYLPLGFWIVGPLGALGVCLSLGRAKRLFPLWGFALIYMIGVVMFFVTSRYRVPVVAVLILLGSYAACWYVQALRGRRWRPLAAATVVLVVMGLVAARTPDDIDEPMLQQHAATGMKLAYAGNYAEAERFLGELVKRADAADQPLEARYWHMLGYVRMRQEKLVDAVGCFKRALEIQPDYPEARGHFGVALAALGRLDQAAEQFERLVHDDPGDATAHANLGGVLARRGRIDEAIVHLLRAIELDNDAASVLVETADTLRVQGRAGEAKRLLRAGAERFPENVTLTVGLVKLLAYSADAAERAEAVRLGEQACTQTHDQNALVLHITALAQFRAGQRERAVKTARRALDAATRQGRSALADEIRVSLEKYRTAARP
jgi:tetratricopeptide (TPR) repeat protein